MRLVSCDRCHTQFDVSNVEVDRFECPCGASVENVVVRPVDVEVRRCSACGATLGDAVRACAYCGSVVVRDPERLSLICPECYGRNPEDSHFCIGCGVAFRPQPVASGEKHPCPVCSAPMPPHVVGGVPVNECGTCHGLWVSGDNFDALIERAIAARQTKPSDGLSAASAAGPRRRERVVYRECPVCSEFMQRRNFGSRSGVIVDWCGDHGTWLDADELGAIAAYIASGGLEPRSTDEVARDSGAGGGRTTQPVDALAEAERILATARCTPTRSPLGGASSFSTALGLLRSILLGK